MLLTNYLTSAWRNILKNKLFSAINIVGLAIGIAAVSLITLFVRSELQYDKFWSKADTIHRAHVSFNVPGRDPVHAVATPGPLIHAMKKDFPQIELASRIATMMPTITQQGETYVEPVRLVDNDFIKIFDLNVIEGQLSSALNDPSSIVLTQTLADKYFPGTNALGQTLSLDFDSFKRDYKVTAVIEDIPEQSQISLNALILIDESDWTNQQWLFEAWFSVNAQLFFTTTTPDALHTINSELEEFTNRTFPKLPMGGDDTKASDVIKLSAMNIKDLHLDAIGIGAMKERGDKDTVMIFSAIAILILIIASINFMNLSTAKASQRAKEVSLRKVMGASRSNLILQFLGESILITLFALIVALVLMELCLPYYNEIINQSLSFDYMSSDSLQVLGLSLIVGIVGGAYPAFVLSSYRPAAVLKSNKSNESSASVKFRALLVVIQFTVSIGLFISTGVVYSQMMFTDKMNPGFDKNNIIVIHGFGRDAAGDKRDVFVNELRRNPQVKSVTWSSETPGNGNENNTMVRTESMSREDALLIGQRSVGYDFFKTFSIELLAGRSYDENRNDIRVTTDQLREGKGYKSSIILNESAVRSLGLGDKDSAIGQSLFIGRGEPSEELEGEFEVIGVINDVHFESLRSTIRPEIYWLAHDWANSVSVNFTGSNDVIMKTAEALWQQEIPGLPFKYSFVSDDVAQQYEAEQGQAKMFATFSGLAILVACLGLYGLASYTAQRRTKEIGIRKVMGASVFDVIKLLIWQFSKPVLVANLIAWPVSFYLMSQWLQSFVYRIDNVVILLLSVGAGLTAMLIAWVTVSTNTFMVAKSNPIKALRYE